VEEAIQMSYIREQFYVNTGEGGKIDDDNVQKVFSGIDEFIKDKSTLTNKILLYCHGGLVNKANGLELTENHSRKMLANHIYPVYFVWESGLLETLEDMFHTIHIELETHNLKGHMEQKVQMGGYDRVNSDVTDIEAILKEVHQSMTPETDIANVDMALPILDDLSHFVKTLASRVQSETKVIVGEVNENLDKTVQHIVKHFSLSDKHIPDVWAQMKETGRKVFAEGGGGDLFLKELLTRSENIEVHIVGHSAGAIVLSTLLDRLNRHDPNLKNLKIKSCTLMAAACTAKLFNTNYAPAIRNGIIEHFFFYTLNDNLEQKDTCMTFAYRKSLLYAISECLEATPEPEKIIGMEIYAEENELINRMKDSKQDSKWIISYGCKSVDPMEFTLDHQSIKLISKNKSHGGFPQDIYTMNSVIKSIAESDTISSIKPDPFFFDPCKRRIVVFGSVNGAVES
jgi:hypothetical protein